MQVRLVPVVGNQVMLCPTYLQNIQANKVLILSVCELIEMVNVGCVFCFWWGSLVSSLERKSVVGRDIYSAGPLEFILISLQLFGVMIIVSGADGSISLSLSLFLW